MNLLLSLTYKHCVQCVIMYNVEIRFSYGMRELVKKYPSMLSTVQGLGLLTFLELIQLN